ncbi:MAG TPA: hypothetical protein VNZ86_00185, partial [Bacteroidia bacterium]|nr:hypothetical protein [Bacteroidia bacterium]
MRIHVFLLSFIFLLAGSARFQAQQSKKVSGVWEGNIEIPGAPIGVVVKINETSGGLEAKISVPAQGGVEYASSALEYKSDSLLITFGQMHAVYRSKVRADSAIISGKWEQNKSFFPLRL